MEQPFAGRANICDVFMLYSCHVFESCPGQVPIIPHSPTRLSLSCLVLPWFVLSCLALSCLVLSCFALPCLALPCFALPCHSVMPHRALDEVFLVLTALGMIGTISFNSILNLQASLGRYEVRWTPLFEQNYSM